MEISVLGGGSWGTALAIHLAKKGYSLKIWEFFEKQAQEMQEKRICPLLPFVTLPENIFISSKMEEIIPKTDLTLVVVPSDKVDLTLKKAQPFLENQPLVICSKGLGPQGELMTELAQKIVNSDLFYLGGPTHAEEVCQGVFSGAVLAGKNKEKLKKIKEILESKTFKIELTTDLIGVQVGAALKNIFAIFIGFLEGKNFGDNTKAYLITKGLAEIKEFGLVLGAQEETFYGLAGLGDLIVTCLSKHSRNRYLGEQIGRGKDFETVVKEMKMVVEGVSTLKKFIDLKEKFKLNLPLIEGLAKILFENKEKEIEGILLSSK